MPDDRLVPRLPDLHTAEPIPETARAEIDLLLESADLFRYTTDGAAVARLEESFAARMGSRYAVATASCSQALFLTMRAVLPQGARVLIPAFTFAAVPSSVIHAGCAPVLCDVGEDYRIDLDDMAAKLPGCDAILVSHMRGHTSDMDAILAAAEARGVPVIEDAAHSLGTTWNGRPIGTLGVAGCFSFQSYKMVNGGEGGMLITDDPVLAARTVIMSGAYEHRWAKHGGPHAAALHAAAQAEQNRWPLYNTRMSNLSAAVIAPQLPLIARRVEAGRRNHDRVAGALSAAPEVQVPAPLPPERRAPDSLQFNLPGLSDAALDAFVAGASRRGLEVQVFGRSADNARAFWNWRFLWGDGPAPDLPRTRAMLLRACDLRLPVRLTEPECDAIAAALLDALDEARATA
jgi:dTDP-4-amino-4,6-dideoxygalactose transaminase